LWRFLHGRGQLRFRGEDAKELFHHTKVIACGAAAEVLTDSPMFAPQIARLFPNQGWLTVKDMMGTIEHPPIKFGELECWAKKPKVWLSLTPGTVKARPLPPWGF
jgi:hypothetical protein